MELVMHTHALTGGLTAIQDAMEIPGLGVLPVNAFLLRGTQPLLVDTGLPQSREEFLTTLGDLVEPADLRWIWLSHPDRDHTGSLYELLELAPQARIITTFLGVGICSIDRPLPMDRVFLLNPGQQLDLGDRTLTCFRPPLYDSPATTGFVDNLTGTVFSSDCFGSPLPNFELAGAGDVSAVPAQDLEDGQRLWATVDSPWISMLDQAVFDSAVGRTVPVWRYDPTSSEPPWLLRIFDRLRFRPVGAAELLALREEVRSGRTPLETRPATLRLRPADDAATAAHLARRDAAFAAERRRWAANA